MQERPSPKKRTTRLLDASGLWNFALKLLGGRALSVTEIKRKLGAKAASPGDVDGVLSRLREYKMIDDVQFAENFATARKETQGFGKFRVLRDLKQRKVSGTVAEQAVAQTFDGTDEAELVDQYLKRKFRKVNLHEHLQDPKHLNSTFRRLQYAGFGAAACIRVLRRYAAQADELTPEPEN